MRIFLDEITKRHGDAPCFDAFDGTVGEVVGASADTLATPSCVMELPYGNDRDHDAVTAAAITLDNNAALPRNHVLKNATGRDVDANITRAARDTARILRAHRLDELLTAISEWQRSTGPERAYARRNALYDLRQWHQLYTVPERRAFEAAVARSQHRRATQ